MPPKVKKVTPKDEYYHVRLRRPNRFSSIRTLPTDDSRTRKARQISKGARVRIGKSKKSEKYYVQGVLIKRKYRNEQDARRLATKIATAIEG